MQLGAAEAASNVCRRVILLTHVFVTRRLLLINLTPSKQLPPLSFWLLLCYTSGQGCKRVLLFSVTYLAGMQAVSSIRTYMLCFLFVLSCALTGPTTSMYMLLTRMSHEKSSSPLLFPIARRYLQCTPSAHTHTVDVAGSLSSVLGH